LGNHQVAGVVVVAAVDILHNQKPQLLAVVSVPQHNTVAVAAAAAAAFAGGILEPAVVEAFHRAVAEVEEVVQDIHLGMVVAAVDMLEEALRDRQRWDRWLVPKPRQRDPSLRTTVEEPRPSHQNYRPRGPPRREVAQIVVHTRPRIEHLQYLKIRKKITNVRRSTSKCHLHHAFTLFPYELAAVPLRVAIDNSDTVHRRHHHFLVDAVDVAVVPMPLAAVRGIP
jgi:hypothetical protein